MTSKPPFDGEVVRLNQLCSKGKSCLRQKDVKNDGPYTVYGASGVVGSMDTYQNEQPYVAVVKDGAGVGRAMLCESKSSVLGTIQALLPNEGTNLSYLLHLVRSLKLGDSYSGSTIPHIYFKDYGKQEVPALSAGRQATIAERLDSVERLMALIDDETVALDFLVKSRFVEMFGTLEHPRYAIVELQDICAYIVDCPHETPKYDGILEYPAIRTSELAGTTIDWSSMKYVSEEEYQKRTRRLIPQPGDIVYAREGTYGSAAILPDGYRFCLGQRTMLFRADASVCLPQYLLFAITSSDVKGQADLLNVGSTVPHVNVKDAKRFRIPLPSLALQREFADFAARVDKLRVEAQKQKDDLQTLYDSLAQDYFAI